MVLEFWVLLGAGVEVEGGFSLISVLVTFILLCLRVMCSLISLSDVHCLPQTKHETVPSEVSLILEICFKNVARKCILIFNINIPYPHIILFMSLKNILMLKLFSTNAARIHWKDVMVFIDMVPKTVP